MMSTHNQQAFSPVLVIDLITSDEDKKYAPAGRIAAAIIQIVEDTGGCLPQDLNEKGFTPDEIYQHWHMAQALANVEINLMCEHKTKLKSIMRGI